MNWEEKARELDVGASRSGDGEGLLGKDTSYKQLLFMRKHRKPLAIACALSVLQQLSGVNGFIFYSTRIFLNSGGKDSQAHYFTAAMGFFNMVTTLSSLLFVDKFGRKAMLVQGCLGMCVAQVLLAVLEQSAASSWVQLALMLVFIGFFESSLGPVLWIYSAETTTDRGVGIVLGFNWVFAVLIGFAFPLLSSEGVIGMAGTFLLFAGCCFLSFLFVLCLVPETKGLTKEEIAEKYYNE